MGEIAREEWAEMVIIFISDIHESHMVPTPAAVLGVVIPYEAAIMSAADARSTSRTGD